MAFSSLNLARPKQNKPKCHQTMYDTYDDDACPVVIIPSDHLIAYKYPDSMEEVVFVGPTDEDVNDDHHESNANAEEDKVPMLCHRSRSESMDTTNNNNNNDNNDNNNNNILERDDLAISEVDSHHSRAATTIADPGENDDSPEVLVRNENNAVQFFRIILLLLLLITAILSASFFGWYLHRNEAKTFQHEYNTLARTMVRSLYDATQRQVWLCRSLANTLTVAIAQHDGHSHDGVSYLEGIHFNLDVETWATLTRESGVESISRLMAYSPLLSNDDERRRFEQALLASEDGGFSIPNRGEESQQLSTLTHSDNGQHEANESNTSGDTEVDNISNFLAGDVTPSAPCVLCAGNDVVVTPTDPLTFADVGTYTCAEVKSGAELGLVPSELCPTLQAMFHEACACGNPLAMEGLDSRDARNRTAQDGIFRQSSDGVFVNQDWNGGPYLPFWCVLINFCCLRNTL
jgi:hypothetical protein